MVFETIILGGVLCVILLIGAGTLWTGVPPLPTSPGVRRTVRAMLPDEVSGRIVDLGSGWGGLARTLAHRYPHNPVIGYERSPLPYWVARLCLWVNPCANLRFHRVDFMAVDLVGVGLAVCYLSPGGMAKLAPKMRRELPADACVVSNFFALPGRHPSRTETATDLWSSPVYLYRDDG